MSGGWFCYLVACADGNLYAGITTDLERRVAEHDRGTASKYTRCRRPVRLVYAEPQPDRAAATRRERELKALRRDQKQELQNRWSGGGPGTIAAGTEGCGGPGSKGLRKGEGKGDDRWR